MGLETKRVGADSQVTDAVGCSTLNPEGAECHQRLLAANRKDSTVGSKTGYETRNEV